MPEMAHAGEDHREARGVGGGDHLVVAHRAAGLDHRGRAGLGGRRSARRGTERTRRTRRPSRRSSALRRPSASAASAALHAAIRAAVDPAHLPGADADRGAVLGVDDGVRLDVLGHASRRTAGRRSRCSVGARWVTTRSRVARPRAPSRVCTRKPPATGRGRQPGAAGIGQRRRPASRRRFFFAREHRARLGVDLRRDHDLGEDLGDRLARSRRRAGGSARRCRRRPRAGRSASAAR